MLISESNSIQLTAYQQSNNTDLTPAPLLSRGEGGAAVNYKKVLKRCMKDFAEDKGEEFDVFECVGDFVGHTEDTVRKWFNPAMLPGLLRIAWQMVSSVRRISKLR